MEPRLTRPEAGNRYYIRRVSGGWSTAIAGKPTDPDCDVLHNCVGYAFGRFNEIAGCEDMRWLAPVNAERFVEIARQQGLTVSEEPAPGAVMCWQKGETLSGSDGAGHVAVVERVISPDEVLVSESGYGAKQAFWLSTRRRENNWGQPAGYTFLGFIRQPGGETAAGAQTGQPRRTLRKGARGEDVRWMQQQLIAKGYLRAAELDGDFGRITLGALLAYQLEHGLDPDGVCGPMTRAAFSCER